MLGIIKAMMSRPEPKKEYIKLWNMAFKNDKKSKLMLQKLICDIDNRYIEPEKKLKKLDILNECCFTNEDYAIVVLLRAKVIFYECGQMDLGQKLFERALDYNPNIASAWQGLGDVLSKQREIERSLMMYEKSLECDHTNPEVLIPDIFQNMQLKRLDLARKHLKELEECADAAKDGRDLLLECILDYDILGDEKEKERCIKKYINMGGREKALYKKLNASRINFLI